MIDSIIRFAFQISTNVCHLGPTASITATFDDYQVIHCYHSSLILTIIATNEALTGQLMNLSNSLKPLITDMAKHVLPAVA